MDNVAKYFFPIYDLLSWMCMSLLSRRRSCAALNVADLICTAHRRICTHRNVVDTRRWIHYCHLTRKSLKRSFRILLADKSVKVSGFQMDFPSLLIMLCRGIGLAALWSKGGEYSSRRSFNLVDPCSAGRRLQCSACRQQIRSGQASWNNRNICIWTPAACSDAGREFGKAL